MLALSKCNMMNHVYRRVNGRWVTGTQLKQERLVSLYFKLSDGIGRLTPICLIKKMKQVKIKIFLQEAFGSFISSTPFIKQFQIMDRGSKGWISPADFMERATLAFS